MEQLKHVFSHIAQTSKKIFNSLHDLGRNAKLDWFVVCIIAVLVVCAGILVGTIEYRKIVRVVTNATPLAVSTTTRDYDFTKAKRTLDTFTQKEFTRQDVVQGGRDITEFPR